MEHDAPPAGATMVVVLSELVRSGGGHYCDTMLWDTAEHARAADERFEATPTRAELAAIVKGLRAFAGQVEAL